jgi:hypothetical protein
MESIKKSRCAVKAPTSPADIGGMEELVVTHSVDPDNLRRLFESLMHEDCVHSWRNFGRQGTLEGLFQWENELRPTQLFFFYLERGGERRMLAASAVADKLTRDFPHPGFCVLGRCYIMPEFRGQGLYRRTLHYRLEYCRARFGNALNAVHIGSVDERITRAITNHCLPGWPNFIHLGEEELQVAGQIRRVGDYLLLVPEYVRKIQNALVGDRAPVCVVALRNVLSTIDSGNIRNLGMLLKETFEEASSDGWFDEHDSYEIEQLLLFCASIPLVGFR